MVKAGRADALALLGKTDFCSYHVPMAFQLDSTVFDAVMGRLLYADDASYMLDSYGKTFRSVCKRGWISWSFLTPTCRRF